MLGSYTEAAVDMLDFFERQREWSFETFGPPEHRGPVGPLKHLRKEAKEALKAAVLAFGGTLGEEDTAEDTGEAGDLREEIADCLFLIFDATNRAGMSYRDLTAACMAKLEKNKGRAWPDWRTVDPNAAVEHQRG